MKELKDLLMPKELGMSSPQITKFSMKKNESRLPQRSSAVVPGSTTQWIQSYLCKSKISQEMVKCLRRFLPIDEDQKTIYTADLMEFIEANEDHEKSMPQRSETNGIAERAVRRVNAGTSSILLRSESPESWWEEAAECHCYSGNI